MLNSIRAVTAKMYVRRLKRISNLVELSQVDNVKTLICTWQASESYKELLANAYDYYVKFAGLKWDRPFFTREEKPIFLPMETELDQLISNCRLKMSVFLETLKETGADSGELWKLRWIDINNDKLTMSITPAKSRNARILKISSYLVSRLLQLPRLNDYVFGGKDIEDFRKCYCEMKTKLDFKMNNPRFKEIAFRSFRH